MTSTTVLFGMTLFFVYLVLLFTAGLMTFRRGHIVLGIVGVFIPVVWLVGAMIPPRGKPAPAKVSGHHHRRHHKSK